ncbi:MAG: FliH/SctL family protein [Nitrospirales bacterium]
MKNKWSRVLTPELQGESVKLFQMNELKSDKEKEEELPPHDCSELQRNAYEQGREVGQAEGQAACQAKVQEEITHLLTLANHIGQVRLGELEERQRDIVEIAMAIAKKILIKELEVDREVLLRQVKQVLQLVSKRELVTIFVHPQDAQLLKPVQDRLRMECDDPANVLIESQDDIERGSCIVEQAGLLLDAQISRQLQTISEEFGLQEVGITPHESGDHTPTA